MPYQYTSSLGLPVSPAAPGGSHIVNASAERTINERPVRGAPRQCTSEQKLAHRAALAFAGSMTPRHIADPHRSARWRARATLVSACLLIGSCSTAGAPSQTSTPQEGTPLTSSAPSAVPTPSSEPTANETPIRLSFGNTVLTATLTNNSTASDLLSQLPLTLTFRDFNRVEKIAALPRPLSTDGVPPGADPEIRDIGYYSPSRDLVLYYGDVGYWNGIVRIGRVDDMGPVQAQSGEFSVTIERAN
jgi:hypothetical protein